MKFYRIIFILLSVYLVQIQAEKKNTSPAEKQPIEENASHFIQFLPEPLSNLKIGDSIQDLISTMGKPAKIDSEQNYFYELSGKKYDTTVGIAHGEVSYIIYSPPAGSLTLQDLTPYISQQTLHLAYQQENKKAPSLHSSDQNFEIELRDGSLSITVRKNTQKSIESIAFLK